MTFGLAGEEVKLKAGGSGLLLVRDDPRRGGTFNGYLVSKELRCFIAYGTDRFLGAMSSGSPGAGGKGRWSACGMVRYLGPE